VLGGARPDLAAYPTAGGDAAAAGGSSLIVSAGGSDGLDLGGTGSSGAPGSVAVVPTWTPPASDDNCSTRCFYAVPAARLPMRIRALR
jgi:hypothetical protein